MERAQAEHQVAAIDADDLARRKQLRERVERGAVVRIVERGNQDETVRDIEIRVAGRKALAIEVNRRGHGKRRNAQAGAAEDFQILALHFIVGVLFQSSATATIVFSSTKRATSSIWPWVSSPAIPCFSQTVWRIPR